MEAIETRGPLIVERASGRPAVSNNLATPRFDSVPRGTPRRTAPSGRCSTWNIADGHGRPALPIDAADDLALDRFSGSQVHDDDSALIDPWSCLGDPALGLEYGACACGSEAWVEAAALEGDPFAGFDSAPQDSCVTAAQLAEAELKDAGAFGSGFD